MHDSDSGIGINSGIISLLAGIGIGIRNFKKHWNPGIGIGIKTLPESCITVLVVIHWSMSILMQFLSSFQKFYNVSKMDHTNHFRIHVLSYSENSKLHSINLTIHIYCILYKGKPYSCCIRKSYISGRGGILQGFPGKSPEDWGEIFNHFPRLLSTQSPPDLMDYSIACKSCADPARTHLLSHYVQF